jgi:hypothetical protein
MNRQTLISGEFAEISVLKKNLLENSISIGYIRKNKSKHKIKHRKARSHSYIK